MTDLHEQVLGRLGDYATSYEESTHLFAAWMGMPVSDGSALTEVVAADRRGEPLSPSVLARRLGMTTGAVTALVNRLEARGLVVRRRESTDRRAVALRPTPSARRRSQRFLASVTPALEEILHDTDRETLEAVERFLGRLTSAMADINTELRDRARAGTPSRVRR